MADTIVYPGAVVVHFEDALVAGRAVMASVRFVALAELAVFYLFVEVVGMG